jgi:hypothetical protein
MHVQHPAVCGQVIKKKDAPYLGPRFKQAAANFLAAKVQISMSESGPKYIAGNGPRWRFRTRQAAATFSLPMHKYGRSFLFFYIENPFGSICLGFKIYTYTGQVCRKDVPVFVAKNIVFLNSFKIRD